MFFVYIAIIFAISFLLALRSASHKFGKTTAKKHKLPAHGVLFVRKK